VLEVEGLTCCYGKVVAVRELSLSVGEGELVTLIGANGAGKTTTLKALSGLIQPTAGRIRFRGQDITRASARRILALGMAHCPEGRRIFPYMSVRENLEMGCYLRGDKAQIAADLDGLFARFPILRERAEQAAGTLSGGEQQMLAISRALMSRPKLVLFDEPSLGLAPKIIDQVYEILMRLRAQRKLTLLIVEQSSTRAKMTGGRMVLIRGGRIVLEGEAADMVKDARLKQAYFGFGDH